MSIVAPAPPITAHLAAAQHPEVVDDIEEVEGHRDHAEQHVGHRQVQDEDVLRGAQQLQRDQSKQRKYIRSVVVWDENESIKHHKQQTS